MDHAHLREAERSSMRVGLLCGLSAYLSWGAVPMYFKLVSQVPAIYVLTHRIIWSVVFLTILTAIRGSWREIRSAVLTRDHFMPLLVSTLLISLNWYVFIFAVERGEVLQASLGYFINPLVNVVLGVAVIGERLRPWQIAGLLLATAGVSILTFFQGTIPWIALILAGSFGLYGLMRKTMRVGAMAGLTVETAILFLPALAVIALGQMRNPQLISAIDSKTYALLMLSGIVTAVPLLLFASAARRLPLSTMGFMQYISPTCQFLTAVFIFGEAFTRVHLVSFGLIWTALLLYSSESLLAYRKRGLLAAAEAGNNRAEPTA